MGLFIAGVVVRGWMGWGWIKRREAFAVCLFDLVARRWSEFDR